MRLRSTSTDRVGATYSDNPSDSIAQKSRIGPESTTSDVKRRSMKEHRVQPERGNRVDVGEDQTKDRGVDESGAGGVEKGSETTESKRGKRQRPIRRKRGSGATTERGNGIVWGQETRDVRERESNRLSPDWGSVCPRPLTVTHGHSSKSIPPHNTTWKEPTAMPSPN